MLTIAIAANENAKSVAFTVGAVRFHRVKLLHIVALIWVDVERVDPADTIAVRAGAEDEILRRPGLEFVIVTALRHPVSCGRFSLAGPRGDSERRVRDGVAFHEIVWMTDAWNFSKEGTRALEDSEGGGDSARGEQREGYNGSQEAHVEDFWIALCDGTVQEAGLHPQTESKDLEFIDGVDTQTRGSDRSTHMRPGT